MIEKVARALALQYAKNAAHREPNDDNWQGEYKAAKAAIEAMREPSEEMCNIGASEPIYHCWGSGGEFTDPSSAGEIYQRMINAALKE